MLHLPREVLEQILLKLDPLSVKTCTRLSREFNTIICSSTALQYLLACLAAGVEDNPRCKLSYAERYKALLKRERRWCGLQPAFTKTLDVKHEPPIYPSDLTSGLYLLGHVNSRDLHYCTLPSTPTDVIQWTSINARGPNRNGDERIMGMGMAVYEHDLVANIISYVLPLPV